MGALRRTPAESGGVSDRAAGEMRRYPPPIYGPPPIRYFGCLALPTLERGPIWETWLTCFKKPPLHGWL